MNVKAGYLRASLTGIFRDLPYVLRNQPGYIPFETMPRDAKITAEKFFAAAVDYYLASLHLRPGIGAGIQMPATFNSDTTDQNGVPIGTTVVVRQQGSIALLPEGNSAKPILQTRASVRWDISEIMSAVAWVQLVHDPNQSLLDTTPDGTASLRTFLSPNFLGGGVSMQARF